MNLVDAHGRIIQSARISVTDRCNYRCLYCMPDGLLELTEKSDILSFDEITRLVGILYSHGVKRIKLTGGEPTVRPNLAGLCSDITTKYPEIELSITTNGALLLKQADELWDAGVRRLNISLDNLNDDKFHRITQRDDLQGVLSGLRYAQKLGFEVKINTVSIKSFNDDDESLQAFIDFSRESGIEIRFIELMPFTGNNWNSDRFISSKDLRDKINRVIKINNLKRERISETASRYVSGDGLVKLGFISSVSESFCANCDRIRITAEGSFRPCLHANREYGLRDLLRSGVDDNEILDVINHGLAEKWREHPDFLSINFKPPLDDRAMILIGG